MKTPVTWILVADGSRARLLEITGRGRVKERESFHDEIPATRDLVADRPGRTFDRAGAGRHAKEPTADAHHTAKAEFPQSVVGRLDAHRYQNDFERLVVIAPPESLGMLRSRFPKRLSKSIHREIDRDVAGFDMTAMQSFLKDHDVN